ncbi:MAG: polysaccharide deacetylase family protein [Anaerolineales bacterium]
MTPSPRLLLTIDYESWYALSRTYDNLSSDKRHALDENFARSAVDPILERLQGAQATFYMVGELVEWYPELPQKIVDAGHEVGFHCQVHRPLTTVEDIKQDLERSRTWRKKYNVRGYRAPMIRTIEDLYPLLKSNDFLYSSSLYAPTGTKIQKGDIWEFPVSTYPLLGAPKDMIASRHMSPSLLLGGEFPYASSMMSGLFPYTVFKIIERELKKGLSPIIFLHPYEIVRPERWPNRLTKDLFAHPLLYPFTLSKASFLDDLVKSFPISTVVDFVNESIHEHQAS